MIKNLTLYSVICALFFLAACSDDEVSNEDLIRQAIDSAALAAENRNHDDLALLIDETYRDHKGTGKQQLINQLRAYFFMHKNIHLFTKVDDVVFNDGQSKAAVTLYVAMAGNVIADASALAGLRAQIYKFELQFAKQETWLLTQAKWQRSSFKEMVKVKY